MLEPIFLSRSFAIVCSLLGGLTILSSVLTISSFFYCHFIRFAKDIKKTYGSWAVITGATDGIGKAMAFELARKGINVVLISRNRDRLFECTSEIKAKYPKVELRFLDIDYSCFDEAARSKVSSFIKDLDVGLLVNNVGISYPFTKYFHELDDDRVAQLMTLNVESTTWMTRLVILPLLFHYW